MDVDLLAACEDLVATVFDDSDDVPQADIERWQALFSFSSTEAVREIQDWRSDLGRELLGASTWGLIQDSHPGFNKESYEYALATRRLHQSTPPTTATGSVAAHSTSCFLLKLGGELRDTATVQAVGNLAVPPAEYRGADDEGEEAEFCVVDAAARESIQQGLRDRGCALRPTFVRISQAEKSLSPLSRHPSLGIDVTMPQHRLPQQHLSPSPAQHEYPVWYFFYGTLADPQVLARVLHRDEVCASALRPARVRGGRLATWAGKYRGLVHADPASFEPPVVGHAFLVRTREEEDALRFYETERYAAVRCQIEFEEYAAGQVALDGLTFLFLG